MSENQKANEAMAPCPICGETIGLRDGVRALHRLVRCVECDTRLRVTADRPMSLQIFRSHGLAFQGGQVRGVWSPIVPSGSIVE